MSTKTELENISGLYFITFTNYKWLHLFSHLNMYNKIYDWFKLLETKDEIITGYVIMPNHIHLLLHHKEKNGSITIMISNAKRFFTYEMVNRLEKTNDMEILMKLSQSISERDKKKGQLHKGFEDSFDCKRCYTEKFIKQKLDYMHRNPIHTKWNLSETTEGYEHSSSAFYSGARSEYPFNLKHYQTILWETEDGAIS